VPTFSEKEERAIYDQFWQVKFLQGRWITFVRTRLSDGRPCFTTFSEGAQTAALAMQTRPEPAPDGGAYRFRVAGWNVYQELVTKLNETGWRCLIVDAPLELVKPAAAPKSTTKKAKGKQ